MSDQGSPGGDDERERLSQDQLVEYVRDVMNWNAYQAAAYVEVVRNGPLEPKDIVATTDIPQGRIYDIMGSLEGEVVNVQGRQPKRYQAQHPRSILQDKQDDFNEKADAATDHLEQQYEIQLERQDPRHPAWVIPGMSGTKRELMEGLESANERVLLLERDGRWIRDDEIRHLERLVARGLEVEVIGGPRWIDKLTRLVEEADATGWERNQVESSFAVIDDSLVIMRVGREHTGVKIQDEGTASVFHSAFQALRQEATEV